MRIKYSSTGYKLCGWYSLILQVFFAKVNPKFFSKSKLVGLNPTLQYSNLKAMQESQEKS